jgi:hypothetical protein
LDDKRHWHRVLARGGEQRVEIAIALARYRLDDVRVSLDVQPCAVPETARASGIVNPA